MSFQEDKIENFLSVFEKQKEFIASFDGCSHLELLKETDSETTYFTYSYWHNEESLNKYRQSVFFKNIWSNVKKMFNDKPQAWSLEKV